MTSFVCIIITDLAKEKGAKSNRIFFYTGLLVFSALPPQYLSIIFRVNGEQQSTKHDSFLRGTWLVRRPPLRS